MTALDLSGQAKGRRRIFPVAALLLLAMVFASLGTWQVRRLAWKEALIAHVEASIHAAPVPAASLPFGPAGADLDYTHVWARGHYEPAATALVFALSDNGNGYWVMVPLRLADGRAVWVNRGFVASGTRREAAAAEVPAGEIRVEGLLRKGEPGATWLRANHPEAERWYYRDPAGLSAARRMVAAGWYLDAALEAPRAPHSPQAGLTVVQFANNHLQYALTWFALAGLCLVGMVLVLRPTRSKTLD